MAALALLATTAAAAAAPTTRLVNQKGGTQTSEPAQVGDINSDGKFVVFETEASLSSKDSNGLLDVYLRNMTTGKVALISVSKTGVDGDDPSNDPTLNASGRFVTFDSEASNLVDGKVINFDSVYLKDRRNGRVELISVNSAEKPANADSYDSSISANGRFVVFESAATNLTKKNTGGFSQIYLRDRVAGKTSLISRNTRGRPGNDDSTDAQISSGGRYVTFVSDADNLSRVNDRGHEQVYRHDRATGRTIMISRKNQAGNDDSDDPEISTRGHVVFESNASNFSSDTNGYDDIYLWKGGRLLKLTKAWHGGQATGGTGGAEKPDITPDGAWVVFSSDSTNLIKNGTNGEDQVYRLRVRGGRRQLVSKSPAQGDDSSDEAHISSNGKFVIFDTQATNLVPGGDANGSDHDVLRRGAY